jgi:hypothetical protein
LREEFTIYHAAAVPFAADHPEPVDDYWHVGTFGKLCVTLWDFWKMQTVKLPY